MLCFPPATNLKLIKQARVHVDAKVIATVFYGSILESYTFTYVRLSKLAINNEDRIK